MSAHAGRSLEFVCGVATQIGPTLWGWEAISWVIPELGIHQGTTDPPHNAYHALVVHEAYATRDTFPGITAFLHGNR